MSHRPTLIAAFPGLSCLVATGVLVITSTGCGLLSAVGNPKVAWAIQDPAPMSVVVRRADAASTTAQEVDRLLLKTPTSLDSAWLTQIGPDPKDAAAQIKAVSQEPMYAKSKARVVSAEVWTVTLPTLKNDSGDKPNLLAAIDSDLGDAYANVKDKKLEIAGEKALIEVENTALDDKATSADDRADHQKTKANLEKMVSKADEEVAPLEKKLLDSAKQAAGKASADTKSKFTPAIVNLLQAVDDASIANGAAAIRYPLALRTMLDSAKEMAPVFVADVIEEKTGNRPAGQLDVGVTLDGTKVTLSLSGVAPDVLGSLNVSDVSAQALDREQKWVTHAIGLLPLIATTGETLSFEHEVLADLLDGFGGPGTVVAVVLPAFDSKEVTLAVAKPRVKLGVAATASADVSVDAKAGSTKGGATAKGGATTKGGAATKGATTKGGAKPGDTKSSDKKPNDDKKTGDDKTGATKPADKKPTDDKKK
jgi:hypothetical protein